jgi:DNA-binding response OmpR family regulator
VSSLSGYIRQKKEQFKQMQKLSPFFLRNFYFHSTNRYGTFKASETKRLSKEQSMSHTKAHILIVEDDPAILRGLQDVLVFNGYAVTGVSDGQQGLETFQNESFDLLLLDVMLPSLDGFSICREVRKQSATQPIIMLTAKGSEDDVVTGFTAGADDYISKPFSLRELMVRVEALLRRSGKNLGETTITLNSITFDSLNLRASHDQTCLDITRKEMDIITYLHRFKNRIVSKQELLTEVWHYTDSTIETRTIDIHMQKLRKKLKELGNNNHLIETIRGEGYRLHNDTT